MQSLPLRIPGGLDLRTALERELVARGCEAAFVVAGMGSLSGTQLRFAAAETPTTIEGPVEMLTLSGTLSPDGVHLHMSVSDVHGRVYGGHVAPGCVVRTTAEIMLMLLPEWSFAREPDPATGYRELVVRPKSCA
jgi:predicted DNA-binding protein with PD1-like motif